MGNIGKKKKKGKLTKIKGRWYVDYISECRGDGYNWHSILPIYKLVEEKEQTADLLLVEKFNKPVIELEGLEVYWEQTTTDLLDVVYATLV